LATQQFLVLLFRVRVLVPQPIVKPIAHVGGRLSSSRAYLGWVGTWPLVVCWGYLAPSSSGLGHHPLKVAARVRIPLGLLL
jgi:hypothetical protein